jgi:hypothetical protein
VAAALKIQHAMLAIRTSQRSSAARIVTRFSNLRRTHLP